MKILPKEKNSENCVLWLRDQLPELPFGLWTLDDKRKIINSNTPVVGCGAISSDGVYFQHEGERVFSGHVALVTKVNGDIITIKEANYKPGQITEREGTTQQLKLVGFFVPERLENNLDKLNKEKEDLKNQLSLLRLNHSNENRELKDEIIKLKETLKEKIKLVILLEKSINTKEEIIKTQSKIIGASVNVESAFVDIVNLIIKKLK